MFIDNIIMAQVSNYNNRMKSFASYLNNHAHQDPFETTPSIFKEINNKLEEASTTLPFSQFHDLSSTIIKRCLKKAEIDPTFTEIVPFIKKWIHQYNSDLELIARFNILECKGLVKKSSYAEALKKLNRVKHIIIDTECEYLMPKVFVLEAMLYEKKGEKEQKEKCLKKCVDYGESYLVEYLKESNEIRLEFAENMIIAYFQMYKCQKETKPHSSIESLTKAYQAALKNFGSTHFSTEIISQTLSQQKNLQVNISKIPTKALTQIKSVAMSKNVKLVIVYNWEDEVLGVRQVKSKNESVRVLSEVSCKIRLDMRKIKVLKEREIREWLSYEGSEICILEEELNGIVGHEESVVNEQEAISKLKSLGKNHIFRTQTHEISSSSEDDDDLLPAHKQEMLMKLFTRDRSVMSGSRSKSKRMIN